MSLNKTLIEWVKNPDGTQGYTWNPITGCLNHNNGLCRGGGFPCYAYKLANGRLRSRYLFNPNVAGYDADKLNGRQKIDILEDPFYPRFWEDRLYHSWGGKPKGIFVCDMSDLFGIGIPEEWTRRVLNLIKLHDRNRYYLLTKQPQNLIKFSPFPNNCWVGVTATGEIMFDNALEWLGQIQASVKYLSLEPYLERINPASLSQLLKWCPISQVIIGSQTKPYKPPEISWVEEIVRAADKAGVPVFQKDNLKSLLGDNLHQELPK